MTGGGQNAPCPNDSLFYELMDFTYTLAVQLGLSPFSVMEQDKDRVIMLINYFIEKGDKEQPRETAANTATVKSHKNDGFWDF